MRLVLFAFACACGLAGAASFECRRNENRVEKMICADAVVSDLDETLARFYAGATSGLGSNASCLKTDQQDWLRRRNACRDTPCLDRAYRERLAELMALQPGINLRRRLDVPELPRLVGALAPEPDRIMAPPVASKPFTVDGQLIYDDRQGAFVIRQPGGRQYIVLLDIMRHGDNATQVPVLEETSKGATLTARGYLSSKEPATPSFDRRHCIYLYRAPS
jgi:uncharacterized protein